MKLELNNKTNTVELAIKLHQGQKDLVGESYIQHLAAVNHNAMSIFTKLMKNKSLSVSFYIHKCESKLNLASHLLSLS